MCEGPGAEGSPKSGILRCGMIEEESDGGCSKEAAHGGPQRPLHLDLIPKTTGNPRMDLNTEVPTRFIFQKDHSAAGWGVA